MLIFPSDFPFFIYAFTITLSKSTKLKTRMSPPLTPPFSSSIHFITKSYPWAFYNFSPLQCIQYNTSRFLFLKQPFSHTIVSAGKFKRAIQSFSKPTFGDPTPTPHPPPHTHPPPPSPGTLPLFACSISSGMSSQSLFSRQSFLLSNYIPYFTKPSLANPARKDELPLDYNNSDCMYNTRLLGHSFNKGAQRTYYLPGYFSLW